jgi:hypothetical protein
LINNKVSCFGPLASSGWLQLWSLSPCSFSTLCWKCIKWNQHYTWLQQQLYISSIT